MRAISLKIPAEALDEAGRLADSQGISRAAYIRSAVEQFNEQKAAELRDERLAAASHLVREDSMRVNAEFDAIEHDVDV